MTNYKLKEEEDVNFSHLMTQIDVFVNFLIAMMIVLYIWCRGEVMHAIMISMLMVFGLRMRRM